MRCRMLHFHHLLLFRFFFFNNCVQLPKINVTCAMKLRANSKHTSLIHRIKYQSIWKLWHCFLQITWITFEKQEEIIKCGQCLISTPFFRMFCPVAIVSGHFRNIIKPLQRQQATNYDYISVNKFTMHAKQNSSLHSLDFSCPIFSIRPYSCTFLSLPPLIMFQ